MRLNVTFHKPETGHIDWQLVADTLAPWPIVMQSPPIRAFTIDVPEAEAAQILDVLRSLPQVKRADFDREGTPTAFSYAAPNDTRIDEQYALKSMNVYAAHQYTQGDPSVIVAVVDSGIDLAHPDYAGMANVTGDQVDPLLPWNSLSTNWWHGQWVAGCIKTSTNNGTGVAGVAPGVSLMVVRLNVMVAGNVSVTTSSTANAMLIAQGNGAHIINLSYGWPEFEQVLADAVDFIYDEGVLITHGAGNNGQGGTLPGYPLGPKLIHVGSIGPVDEVSTFTSYGTDFDIVAPGTNILLPTALDDTGWPDGYRVVNGTSFSAPHVAAVAALVKSVNPALTAQQITALLYETARPVITYGFDDFFTKGGVGCVDAHKAVLKAISLLPENSANDYPYVNMIGPNKTTTVADSTAVTTINNPVGLDAGIYGQNLTANTGIEIVQNGEVRFTGKPTTFTPPQPLSTLVNMFSQATFLGFTGDPLLFDTVDFITGGASIDVRPTKNHYVTFEGTGKPLLLSIYMRSLTYYLRVAGYSYAEIFLNGERIYFSTAYAGYTTTEHPWGWHHWQLGAVNGVQTLRFTAVVVGNETELEFKVDSIRVQEYPTTIGVTSASFPTYDPLSLAVVEMPFTLNPIKTPTGIPAGSLKSPSGGSAGVMKTPTGLNL